MADPSVRHADDSALHDPARRAAVVALAAVLALDGADRTALGALAPALMAEFNIGNAAIGLLASAFAIVGAIAIVPIGILTDRARRVTILVICICIWFVAMGVAAAAWSFALLFIARITLGVLTAAGGPPITSMVGDLFPTDVRSRVLGWVKSGELVGAGIGFLVAGVVVWLTSWRGVFAALALLGVVVAWAVARVPEPRRGGENDLPGEQQRSIDAPTQLHELVEEQHVEPKEELVLEGDQSELPLKPAMKYVLKVKTVVLIIAASALGDVFFTALQVFGVLFLVGQFGISASEASILIPLVGAGGFVGVLAGGRLGDRLIERGVLTGRVHVGAWSYLAASVMLVPVFLVSSLWVALPFLVLSGAFLTAPIAPLEAARLDVVHPQLRGRTESARMIARVAAQAGAPLVFGVLSGVLGSNTAQGLQLAFLMLLPLLAASSVCLMIAARHYPSEVAAVEESEMVEGA
ncbi:MAG TPA: MFS transporter [Acidimicrobiia bacterium]|nr:MFS transporter [Acidimicrobiia bacterium]